MIWKSVQPLRIDTNSCEVYLFSVFSEQPSAEELADKLDMQVTFQHEGLFFVKIIKPLAAARYLRRSGDDQAQLQANVFIKPGQCVREPESRPMYVISDFANRCCGGQ